MMSSSVYWGLRGVYSVPCVEIRRYLLTVVFFIAWDETGELVGIAVACSDVSAVQN